MTDLHRHSIQTMVALKNLNRNQLRALMRKRTYLGVVIKCPETEGHLSICFDGEVSIRGLLECVNQHRQVLFIPEHDDIRVQDHWNEQCLDKTYTTSLYTKYKDFIRDVGTVEDTDLDIITIETNLVFYVNLI